VLVVRPCTMPLEPSNCSEVVLYPAATGRHTSLEGSEVWYTL
jgi:hypothetical protein